MISLEKYLSAIRRFSFVKDLEEVTNLVGVHDFVVKRLAQFIQDIDLTKFNFKSDKEPASISMFEQACILRGGGAIEGR